MISSGLYHGMAIGYLPVSLDLLFWENLTQRTQRVSSPPLAKHLQHTSLSLPIF